MTREMIQNDTEEELFTVAHFIEFGVTVEQHFAVLAR